MKRFLLLGDSITERALDFADGGWALRLQDVYRRKVDIYDRGFSGYNTRWLLNYLRDPKRVNDILPCPSFDLAVIFLGANDSTIEEAYQHVPLEEYKKNLKELCLLVRSSRVILVTPPPYDADKYKRVMNYPVSFRTDERSKMYAAAVCEVAQSFVNNNNNNSEEESQKIKVECVNINDAFRERLPHPQWVDALNDGLHLGSEGNRVVSECLLEAIQAKFPELHPSSVTDLLPKFRVFDPKNTQNYEPETEEEMEMMVKVAAAAAQAKE